MIGLGVPLHRAGDLVHFGEFPLLPRIIVLGVLFF